MHCIANWKIDVRFTEFVTFTRFVRVRRIQSIVPVLGFFGLSSRNHLNIYSFCPPLFHYIQLFSSNGSTFCCVLKDLKS
jgi:hypothetical protein